MRARCPRLDADRLLAESEQRIKAIRDLWTYLERGGSISGRWGRLVLLDKEAELAKLETQAHDLEAEMLTPPLWI